MFLICADPGGILCRWQRLCPELQPAHLPEWASGDHASVWVQTNLWQQAGEHPTSHQQLPTGKTTQLFLPEWNTRLWYSIIEHRPERSLANQYPESLFILHIDFYKRSIFFLFFCLCDSHWLLFTRHSHAFIAWSDSSQWGVKVGQTLALLFDQSWVPEYQKTRVFPYILI